EGGDVLSLAAAGASGADRGTGGAGERRRSGRVLRLSRARQPARLVVVAAEPADGACRCARRAPARDGSTLRERSRAAPAALVRVAARAGAHRVLAPGREPAPRAARLPPRRRRAAPRR